MSAPDNSTAVASPPSPARVPAGRAALSGVVAALAALATGELLAGLLSGAPGPVAAVGSMLIDLAPPGSKEVVVGLFGTNDKVALGVLVIAVVLLVGAVIGLLARRGTGLAAVAIVALVAVGALASFRDPTASPSLVAVSAAVQVGVGYWVLVTLLGWARTRPAGVGRAASGSADDAPDPSEERRRFLVGAGAIGLLAVFGGMLGRRLVDGRAETVDAAALAIPDSVDPAPSVEPDNAFAIAGLTPVVTPNDAFYRIDTALTTPTPDVASWRLRVHGMVDREVSLTFDELAAMPLLDRYVTIACVSNEVGGKLIGNAKWTGVRLTDVLDMAGVQPGATQVVPRSVDGWTAGFPTEWVTAPERPRDALIVLKMNDQPLPAAHGFPARLIVPGLYGYVSATKWLSELELTTLEAFDAYWVPRGWAKEAPILTQSRIDVPRQDTQFHVGDSIVIAGVAWAPDRGVSRVEVRVDDGEWQPATMATEIGPQTWVQWKMPWTGTAGRHTFTVRATDGTGAVQEEGPTPPPPDGARGYHAVSVQVD